MTASSKPTRIFHGVCSDLPMRVVALRGEQNGLADGENPNAQTIFLVRSYQPLRVLPELCGTNEDPEGEDPTEHQLALLVNGDAEAETIGFAITQAYSETLIRDDSRMSSRFVDWAKDDATSIHPAVDGTLGLMRSEPEDIKRLSSEVFSEGELPIATSLVTTKDPRQEEVLTGHVGLSVYLRDRTNGDLQASAPVHDLLGGALFEMIKLFGTRKTRAYLNQALKGLDFPGFLPPRHPLRKVLAKEVEEEIETLRSQVEEMAQDVGDEGAFAARAERP